MSAAGTVVLTPGAVFRTAALRRWGRNPAHLARRLEQRGQIQRVRRGLLYVPRITRFGAAPPSEHALLDAFLSGPWVVTGPSLWNALGLGSTAMHTHPLVYNTRRTGVFVLGERTFHLRRVAFPAELCAEWFIVDLFRNAASVGLDREDLLKNIVSALHNGRFDRDRLVRMADQFGGRQRYLLRKALQGGVA